MARYTSSIKQVTKLNGIKHMLRQCEQALSHLLDPSSRTELIIKARELRERIIQLQKDVQTAIEDEQNNSLL